MRTSFFNSIETDLYHIFIFNCFSLNPSIPMEYSKNPAPQSGSLAGSCLALHDKPDAPHIRLPKKPTISQFYTKQLSTYYLNYLNISPAQIQNNLVQNRALNGESVNQRDLRTEAAAAASILTELVPKKVSRCDFCCACSVAVLKWALQCELHEMDPLCPTDRY